MRRGRQRQQKIQQKREKKSGNKGKQSSKRRKRETNLILALSERGNWYTASIGQVSLFTYFCVVDT